MFDDPAVRSVRVAVALCDRFAELLKGPSQVRARKQSGALFGVSGNDSELSLRIGEAQQVYPEIWRHLDEARAAFASRGVDVAGYDRLRAAEGPSLGADVDVKYSKHGYGDHAIEETVKSANFNKAGLARARQACNALMSATPQIDWAAIAKAESQDPAVAAFARATRFKRWIRLGLLALVISSPFLYIFYQRHKEQARIDARARGDEVESFPVAKPRPIDPAKERERAELAAIAAQLEASLAAARKNWAAAVAPEALAKAVPGSRPCDHPIKAPPEEAADRFVRIAIADPKVFARSDFYAYAAGAPVQDEALERASLTVDEIDRWIASGHVRKGDREQLASITPHVAFVIIDREVKPQLTGSGAKATYVPGAVTGRAYVYSVRDAKIRCAGTIDARNTASNAAGSYLEAVRAASDGHEVLHREIEVRIRQALAAGLRSIDP